MSAIGGIIDFKNGAVDFCDVDGIRKAMCLRGRIKSSAYIDAGIGMFCNSDDFTNNEQPILTERRGYKSVLLLDAPFLDGNTVFEKYRCAGVEFLGLIDASFAIALYDSERRLLLLARDRDGRKPLFYSAKNGRVCFSSEAKGILALSKGAIRVNRELLSLHLTSPKAIYTPSDIYNAVYEVRAGECILFTELGVCRFFYKEGAGQRKILPKTFFKENDIIYEPCEEFEEKDVFEALSNSLVAFDIPQFHYGMTELCRLFSFMKGNERAAFRYRDYLRKEERGYSYEVEDRLGSFYGVLGCGAVSRLDSGQRVAIEESREKIRLTLLESFFDGYKDNDNEDILRRIFGDRKLKYLLELLGREKIKKEDTESQIRILGMLCQTFEWVKLRTLDIRSDGSANGFI